MSVCSSGQTKMFPVSGYKSSVVVLLKSCTEWGIEAAARFCWIWYVVILLSTIGQFSSPLYSFLGLPDVSTATWRLFGHSSSKLFPLVHVDKVVLGLCIAFSFIALNWKNAYLHRSQEIHLIPMPVCRRNWYLFKLEEGFESSDMSCILVISGLQMIGSISYALWWCLCSRREKKSFW